MGTHPMEVITKTSMHKRVSIFFSALPRVDGGKKVKKKVASRRVESGLGHPWKCWMREGIRGILGNQ